MDRFMILKCVLYCLIMSPGIRCQFSPDTLPDMAFGDHNDRFDISGMTQDHNNGLYVEENDDRTDRRDARRSYYIDNKPGKALRRTDEKKNRRHFGHRKINLDDSYLNRYLQKQPNYGRRSFRQFDEVKPSRRSNWVDIQNAEESKINKNPNRRWAGGEPFVPYSYYRRITNDDDESEMEFDDQKVEDMIQGRGEKTFLKRASELGRRHNLVHDLRRDLLEIEEMDSMKEHSSSNILDGFLKTKKKRKNTKNKTDKVLNLNIALPLKIKVKDTDSGTLITGIKLF